MNSVWLVCVTMAMTMWTSTCLLYKAGAKDAGERHICLKFSVCIGIVFFVIALVYLITRDEPFTIWESAVRFWPITAFAFVYAIVNTISFNGFVYNEATVESPVEGISGGSSSLLLILAFLFLGRVDSVFELLTPLRTMGILLIMVSIACLAFVRNREEREDDASRGASWKSRGLGTLVFPLMYAVVDGLETIVTGVCLDSTYGYAMPEGDSIIIIGMVYALFALGFWIYMYVKDGTPYNPFERRSAPRMLGALADNVGIVFYSYAMAADSVSTDPIIAAYPIFVMIGGRLIMKERVSGLQYTFLLGIVLGSVMVIADTVV